MEDCPWGDDFLSSLGLLKRITGRELLLAPVMRAFLYITVYRGTINLPSPNVYGHPNIKRKIENNCLLNKKILNLTKDSPQASYSQIPWFNWVPKTLTKFNWFVAK